MTAAAVPSATPSPLAPPQRVVAMIGSRKIDDDTEHLLRQTAAVLASRGGWIRSGGADGADTAAAEGASSVAMERLILALPARRHAANRTWGAALRWNPPYPREVELLAQWEWEAGLRLPAHATPETLTPLAGKVALGTSWQWLLRDSPHVAELMVRNAAIIAGRPTPEAPWPLVDLTVDPATLRRASPKAAGRPLAARETASSGAPVDSPDPVVALPTQMAWPQVASRPSGAPVTADDRADVVIAAFDPTVRRGGGTGHGWRLAQALGIPTFNVRELADREALRAWCDEHLPARRPRRGRTPR